MEAIRDWAASVIAAAVLAGITEFALPKGHLEKSVKILLSLFMLVTFLSPAVSMLTAQKQTKSGLDELLEEYEAQQALEETVKETLEREIVSSIRAFAEAEGMALADVKAVVSIGNDHIVTVRRIEIGMDGTAEEIKKMDDYVFQNFSTHPSVLREGRNAKNNERETTRMDQRTEKR